jgi:GNAT superfamily N-acetyltransferase
MAWREGRCADNAGNKAQFQARVDAAAPAPGVLAYAQAPIVDKASQATASWLPVGWVAIAPRAEYPRMERGKVLRAIDARPAWVISCFYIHRHWRRRGLQRLLIEAACDYARSQGAELVEAYPQEPKSEVSGTFFWTGTAGAFLAAGFSEVARNTPARPVMRRVL